MTAPPIAEDAFHTADELDIVVLCGGAGRRMGGADKPLLQAGPARLIDYCLTCLPPARQILVSANRNLPEYRQLGHPVIADLTPDLGPIGGLVSCLPHLQAPYVYVVPGDAAFVPQSLAALLLAATDTHRQAAAIYRSQERVHYLPVVVKRTALLDAKTGVAAYLATGARSVRGLLERLGYAEWQPQTDLAPLVNINDPADLAALRGSAPDLPS